MDGAGVDGASGRAAGENATREGAAVGCEATAHAADPIYVLDELELGDGMLEPFLAAMEASYRPGAEARGMTLLHTWVMPPTSTPGIPLSVLLVWRLEGLPGFWQMRSQNATPEVARWWSDCDAFVVSRTRRFAASADSIAGFEALGHLNA